MPAQASARFGSAGLARRVALGPGASGKPVVVDRRATAFAAECEGRLIEPRSRLDGAFVKEDAAVRRDEALFRDDGGLGVGLCEAPDEVEDREAVRLEETKEGFALAASQPVEKAGRERDGVGGRGDGRVYGAVLGGRVERTSHASHLSAVCRRA